MSRMVEITRCKIERMCGSKNLTEDCLPHLLDSVNAVFQASTRTLIVLIMYYIVSIVCQTGAS